MHKTNMFGVLHGHRHALMVSTVCVLALVSAASAETVDLGDIQVEATKTAGTAVGSRAEPGSAAALSISQGTLDASQPGSIVSDKIIQDVSAPSADYNEVLKYTPGFTSSNPNGFLGDSKASWRGFSDGQYNVTFDGIPVGKPDDTHHSTDWFPGAFLGQVSIDRGPGNASQIGNATFGGTLSSFSHELSDKYGAELQASYGTFNSISTSGRLQTGLVDKEGTKYLLEFSHNTTDGSVKYGRVQTDFMFLKAQHQFGDVLVTGLYEYGYVPESSSSDPTQLQLKLFGKTYGALNNNPATQQYIGFNRTNKQSDFGYIDFHANELGVDIDNNIYTYSYRFLNLQNTGSGLSIEGPSTIANGGTINKIKLPIGAVGAGSPATTVTYSTVKDGDVTGYLKQDSFRAYGDSLKLKGDIVNGWLSGQLRTGIWLDYYDNNRLQAYYDYTQGVSYVNLPNNASSAAAAQASAFKYNITQNITDIQPYLEYEWKPIDGLSITPGYKYQSFNRYLHGPVNQTALNPIDYGHTYSTNLPFLDVRYRVLPELTLYGQASKGFLTPTLSAFYVTNPATDSIKPQQTTNFQAGAVYKSGNLTADFDVYSLTATNFPVTGLNPDGTTYYFNAGTAAYKGLEAEATYSLVKNFSVTASGSLSNAKFVHGANTGLAVPNAPNYTAAGGVIYDDQTYFGSLLYKVTGEQFGANGQVSGNNLNKVAAYNSTDFVVGYRTDYLKKLGFGDKAEFKLGVQNIFNNQAITQIGGDPTKTGQVTVGGPNVAGGALTYEFQSGRLIYGEFKVTF